MPRTPVTGASSPVDAATDAATDAVPEPSAAKAPARAMRRWLLTITAVVVTTVAAARVTSWSEVRAVLDSMSTRHVLIVAGLTAVNLVTYWFVLTASVPGLSMARASAVQLPSTTLSNVIPGGGALGTAFTVMKLRSWGHSAADIAAALLVNGVLGMAAKITAAFAALLVLSPSAEVASAAPVLAGVVLAALVATVARLMVSPAAALRLSAIAERFAAVALRLVGRDPNVDLIGPTMRVQRDVRLLVRRRWAHLVIATVTSHVALFALFVACFRAVGVQPSDVSTSELLGSFGVARLAALIPLTPGGIGLIEISLAATLTTTGGDPAIVVAGVGLYRFTTYAVPTVLGAIGLGGWAIVSRPNRAAERLGDPSVPLVVDLDGTLLPVTSRSIMLARLLWRRPLALGEYVRLKRRDRPASKLFLLETAGFDPGAARVHGRLLRRLEREHRDGRPIYLASGAPEPVVRRLVERFPMFTAGWGSTADQHLVGPAKAALLCDRFGRARFDYIGDAREDLAVWRCARTALLFHPSRRVLRAARRELDHFVVLRRPPGATLVLAMRFVLTAVAQLRARSDRPTPSVAR